MCWTQTLLGIYSIYKIKKQWGWRELAFFLTYKLDARDFGSTLKSEERFPLISLEQALHAHARWKLTILEIQLSVQPQARGGMRSKLWFGAHFTPQHAQRQAAEATRCTLGLHLPFIFLPHSFILIFLKRSHCTNLSVSFAPQPAAAIIQGNV